MGRDREPKHAKPQTKNRRLQIHDLHAVHWNVRGKTVQEVLDTMQDIIHAPDFLLLQEVGGLGKADASVVQTFPIWAGRIKYTCFHVDTAQGFRQACILVKHPFTDCIHCSVALKVGLAVQLRPKSQRPIFFSLVISHTGREQMPKMFGAKELRKFRICCNNVVRRIWFSIVRT